MRDWWENWGWLTVTAIFTTGFILFVFITAVQQENAAIHRAYNVWVKVTENPHGLTFEEWNDLRKATKHDDTTIIYTR